MKLILIDDDYLVTSALKTILIKDGFDVVATGLNGHEAISLYQKHNPDIIVMDIRMEGINGIQTTEEIMKYDPNAKVLLLTTFKDDEYIFDAIKLGVKGYLLKQDYENISAALHSILANQTVFVDDVISKIPSLMKKERNNDTIDILSDIELEIIKLIAQGLNNKEIAQQLFLSDGTIRNYISLILSKLDLRDRTQIAIFYYTKIAQ